MEIHLTLEIPDAAMHIVRYYQESDPVQLQDATAPMASELTAGQVVQDGLTIVATHGPV